MEVFVVSLLNGLVYGMLLFMLASGLTLILSMMGVLNFAHASAYMLGAYFAYTISLYVGFWPALVIAPLLCGLIGAAIEMWGLRRVHRNGHIAELLFTFGLAFIIEKGVQMTWGLLPVPYRVPELLDFPLFTIYGTQFPAYRAFMLLISALMFGAIWLGLTRTRIGLVIQAALTHPDMAARARPQRAAHLHARVRRRHGAGRPRRRDRRQLPGHRAGDGLHHGADRVRRGGVRRAGLAGRLLHRLDPDGADPDLCRGVRRVAGRPAGEIRLHGDVEHAVCRGPHRDRCRGSAPCCRS